MKKLLIALVAMSVAAVQAEVINMCFNSSQNPGGSDIIMDGTASNGANAPTNYPGTSWNEYGFVPTAAAQLLATDSAGAATTVSVQFAGAGNMWEMNAGAIPNDLGALASYSWATTSMTLTGGSGLYDIYILTQDNNPNATSFTIGADTQTTIATLAGTYIEGENYVKFSGVDITGGVTMTINQGPINGFQMAAVPEPATIGLLGVFGGAMIFIRRKLTIS